MISRGPKRERESKRAKERWGKMYILPRVLNESEGRRIKRRVNKYCGGT